MRPPLLRVAAALHPFCTALPVFLLLCSCSRLPAAGVAREEGQLTPVCVRPTPRPLSRPAPDALPSAGSVSRIAPGARVACGRRHGYYGGRPWRLTVGHKRAERGRRATVKVCIKSLKISSNYFNDLEKFLFTLPFPIGAGVAVLTKPPEVDLAPAERASAADFKGNWRVILHRDEWDTFDYCRRGLRCTMNLIMLTILYNIHILYN